MSLIPSNAGKSLSLSAPPPTSHSPGPPASAAPAGFDNNRRPPPASTAQPIPKKGQALRKQHRNQKRPGSRAPDDDDAMAELRAVRNPSSRRGQTSITHLMSYSLSSRPYVDHRHHNRSYRRNPTWGLGSGYHAVDKARYVHANYRFIATPTGSYAAQAADADEHLDWADILQILASTESQAASCPICLSEPVAPRMARCGHIFCLPCLIRFMNSGDNDGPSQERKARWKKCPICEDSIYLSDVRPVRFYAGQESPLPRPGDDVVLRLMTRSAKSTLALPKDAAADVLNPYQDIPWHFAANVLDYARVMKGTGDYMVKEFDREIEDLAKQEKEDEIMFHEDGEWTQRAIRAINTAKEKAAELGGMEVALAQPSLTAPQGQGDHDFYFYTCPPHLYLSPLDIRILKTKFGAFANFPSTVLPRVEHISTGHVVDDALRKRAKYLGHLPHGCLISFLECDWTDIIPADILATFADEIERRRRANRDKAAQEDRERLQAERQELAALHGRGARRNAALEEDVTVRFSAQPSEDIVDLADFAPLGAEATTPPNPRPGFAHLASMSTSPGTSRTVWGTPAIQSAASPELVPREVDDGWLRDEDVLGSLGVAELAVQMEALGIVPEGKDSGASTPGGGGGGGGGGKKKKKQKITLMSTGGRRGGT
jgi:hypothetical protein